jgi:SAM-dependent methyltransferase
VPATAALWVEESRTTSGAIAAILVSREPSLSLPPTDDERPGVIMAKRTIVLVLGTLLLAGATVIWATRARRSPAACPYSQRLFLDLPRPFMRRQTLRDMLDLAPGERVLEVGPGTGYYSLDVARQIAPHGRLDVLDLQQSMLDELMRRAAARGIGNIMPMQGDAQRLPYPDATFDAAFLVATLGEIPDKEQALRELRRVLKPSGRLIVGEGQPDPHAVSRDRLHALAGAADLTFERHARGRLGYFARFRAG